MRAPRIDVLLYRVGWEPRLKNTANTLRELRRLVGGELELVRLSPELVLLCDEEGRQKDRPPNRCFVRFGTIRGDFIVCRLAPPTFGSALLSDVELVRRQTLAVYA